jgi:methyl-accepting chemotaxis protein
MKNKLTLGHLIFLQAAAGILVAVLLLINAMWANSVNERASEKVFVAKDVTADILPPPMYLIELKLNLAEASVGKESAEELRKAVDRLEKEYLDRVAYWNANPPFGLETQLMGAQHDSALKLIASAREVVKKMEAGDSAGVQTAMASVDEAYQKHREGVDSTVLAALAFADQSMQGLKDKHQTIERLQWGVMVLGVVVLFAAAFFLLRKIVAPLNMAVDVAQRIAQGDLTHKVGSDALRETGQLLLALDAMKESLRNTVGQVRMATDSINTASSEIASGNQDLSSRTEQTASNLEQTAASLEQLTSTVAQSSDAARQANQLAVSASEVAVRGGAVVNQVVTTMDEINHSSKKISDIIGVIDGIAFQTNILALNAAVEAARAGEQGRGFAVVAAEVRNLAQRSAEAAKEIKGLIGTSVDKVDAGSRLVARAGQTMEEIVGSVQRVTDIIGEITAASGEQSDGISQVNTAVSQLDQMTQQNAALVEQSAAAAESLKDQAVRLAQVVQVFRLR